MLNYIWTQMPPPLFFNKAMNHQRTSHKTPPRSCSICLSFISWGFMNIIATLLNNYNIKQLVSDLTCLMWSTKVWHVSGKNILVCSRSPIIQALGTALGLVVDRKQFLLANGTKLPIYIYPRWSHNNNFFLKNQVNGSTNITSGCWETFISQSSLYCITL